MLGWTTLTKDQRSWFGLIFSLVLFFILFAMIGRELISVVISLILAYLMQKPMMSMQKYGIHKVIATYISVGLLFTVIGAILFGLIPPIFNQANSFLKDLPNIIDVFQKFLSHMAEHLPNYLTEDDISRFAAQSQSYFTSKSTNGIVYLINMIPLTFEVLVYCILVPMMVFFFLKDDDRILRYLGEFMPSQVPILSKFWHRLDVQLGNYLQGKVVEVFIVGLISIMTYGFLKLKFAFLMGCLMGISVLIPIVGATLVTIPIILIGFWQFGTGDDTLIYLLIAHMVILIADGNLLVPILFSEKLNLHPLAILISILFFGAFLGFWGLFFAIPLLTGINILLNLFKLSFINPQQQALT